VFAPPCTSDLSGAKGEADAKGGHPRQRNLGCDDHQHRPQQLLLAGTEERHLLHHLWKFGDRGRHGVGERTAVVPSGTEPNPAETLGQMKTLLILLGAGILWYILDKLDTPRQVVSDDETTYGA